MKPVAKIFLSDLHVGEGDNNGAPTADDFTNEKETHFVNLITKLIEDVEKGSELILLGDIFDLIEQDVEQVGGSYDMQAALIKAMAAHKRFVNALKKWLKAGNKIFYIVGNHDHAMRHMSVAGLLAEKILNTARAPWHSFVIDDWYYSKTFLIYAEHGHRFDLDNVHAGREDNFGAMIVREALRPLERDEWGLRVNPQGANKLEIIDNARPRGRLVDFIQRLVKDGYLRQDAEQIVRGNILDTYRNDPNISWVDKTILDNSILRNLLVTDNKLRKELNRSYESYHKHARKMIQKEGLQLRDLSFKPSYIVMGHTHFFDDKDISVKNPKYKAKYLNLASWLDTVYIDKKGNAGIPYEGCPYLIFTKTGSGPVRYALYDARDGKKITKKTIKALKAQRRMD